MARSLRTGGASGNTSQRARIYPGPRLDALVLQVLARAPVPLSPYALAGEVKSHGGPGNVPSTYRSLDRLVGKGSVERVETLGAYRIRTVATPVLMVCSNCGQSGALDVAGDREHIAGTLAAAGFALSRLVVEAVGLCTACQA